VPQRRWGATAEAILRAETVTHGIYGDERCDGAVRATAEKNGSNHHMFRCQEASATHRRRLAYFEGHETLSESGFHIQTKQTPPAIQPGQTSYGVHEATVLWKDSIEHTEVSLQRGVCGSEEQTA
jgi:hypothetical protein